MFTEGQYENSAAPNITLKQARDRLYELLETPGLNCETCGQIRIQPDDSPTNSSDPGAILKIDVTGSNTCLGSCVGPNSFSETTPTPTPTPSQSGGDMLKSAGGWSAEKVFASAATAWFAGLSVFFMMAV